MAKKARKPTKREENLAVRNVMNIWSIKQQRQIRNARKVVRDYKKSGESSAPKTGKKYVSAEYLGDIVNNEIENSSIPKTPNWYKRLQHKVVK